MCTHTELGMNDAIIYWHTVYWRTWQPTPVLLPGKIAWTEGPGRLQSMGSQRINTTERLHFHFSLSCIGEGNGNPLQCSYLENPRDRGAWWAAVYGGVQSRTRLKWLSSSSIQCIVVVVYSLSHVWLFVTPWTVAHQAPLSMGFSRQEYCSGLLFPSPGDLPDPRIEYVPPTWQADSFHHWATWEAHEQYLFIYSQITCIWNCIHLPQ